VTTGQVAWRRLQYKGTFSDYITLYLLAMYILYCHLYILYCHLYILYCHLYILYCHLYIIDLHGVVVIHMMLLFQV